MRRLRATIGFLCFLLGVSEARDASAFCRATNAPDAPPGEDGCQPGLPLYWGSTCAGIHVDAAASKYLSLEDTQALLAQAFNAWTAAQGACGTSMNVLVLEPAVDPAIVYKKAGPNENDLLFQDDAWPHAAGDTFELVTTTFQQETGEILDGDIEINGARVPELLAVSGGADAVSSNGLRRLFLHAAGHFLGFAHSHFTDSVMYSQFSPDDSGPVGLAADDVAAMCAVYPASGERPVIDSSGREATASATTCVLGAATEGSPCGGSSDNPRIDHGMSCSVSVLAPSAGGNALAALTLAAFAGLRSRVRRRRGWIRTPGGSRGARGVLAGP